MDLIFAIGMPGGWEWIIIGLIVVIFFGANKIPEIFRGFGKGIREFKDASKEIKKSEVQKNNNHGHLMHEEDPDLISEQITTFYKKCQ